MKRSLLLAALFCMLSYFSIAQNEKERAVTLTPEQSKQILSSIKFDTAKILRDYSLASCNCIDSALQARKTGDPDPNESIKKCIDRETVIYQSVMEVYNSMLSGEKDIVINTNPNSAKYKSYYSDIEEWLADSCSSLRVLLGSNDDDESEFSYSKDPAATKQYNAGLKYFNKEDYASALPYFKKAVEIDPKFVFALDNLAVCHRRTGQLDKALAIYARSLEIYPKGKTPLQNIPVIYELQKDYDKAIEGYKKVLKYYPDDTESFYGLGRVLMFYKDDFPKGLDYMCKAYNGYVKMKSAYRSDAEKNLAYAYNKMKEQGKEDEFFKILESNNIKAR